MLHFLKLFNAFDESLSVSIIHYLVLYCITCLIQIIDVDLQHWVERRIVGHACVTRSELVIEVLEKVFRSFLFGESVVSLGSLEFSLLLLFHEQVSIEPHILIQWVVEHILIVAKLIIFRILEEHLAFGLAQQFLLFHVSFSEEPI